MIAQHGKISTAASALGLTSPAVTIQVQQAETELGAQIFIRQKSGIRLTGIGETVIEHARTILSNLDALQEEMAAFNSLASGTIRLGVVSTGKYFAPRVIAEFAKEYPALEIKLFAANRADIVRRLKNHEIDVALMGRPPRDIVVKSTIIGDHPHVFIANREHPLTKKLDITQRDLAEHRFIMREPGSGTRSMFELFMAEELNDYNYNSTEMDSNETIKQAVIAGLGIAFISGHTIEQELETGKLVILDVVDTPIKRHWFLVRAASRASTPAIEAFDRFLFENGMRLLPLISKPYQTSDRMK